MTAREADEPLPAECGHCGNSGCYLADEGAPVETFCSCEWGAALRLKDHEGSLYTVRAFILRGDYKRAKANQSKDA